MYTTSRLEGRQGVGNRVESRPTFDVNEALDTEGFMDFLGKFQDVKEKRFRITEAGSGAEVKRRFEVFEAMPKVSAELKRVLQEKILKMSKIDFKQEDMKNVDEYLEREIFTKNNFEVVLNLDTRLKELAELPARIKDKEFELQLLGGRTEAIKSKVEEEKRLKIAEERLRDLHEDREAWGLVKEKQQSAKSADLSLSKAKNYLETQGNKAILEALSNEAQRLGDYLQVFSDLKKDISSSLPEAQHYLTQFSSIQEALEKWKEQEGQPDKLHKALNSDPKKGQWNAINMKGQLEATIDSVKHLASKEISRLDSDPDLRVNPKQSVFKHRLKEIVNGVPSLEEESLKAEGLMMQQELETFQQLQDYMGILREQPWRAELWAKADEAFQKISHLRNQPGIGPVLESYATVCRELNDWAIEPNVQVEKLEKAAKAWRAPLAIKNWLTKKQKSLTESDFEAAEQRIENIDKANAEKSKLRTRLSELQTQIFVQLEPAWQVLDKTSKKIEEKINHDFFGEDKDLKMAFAAIDYLDSVIAAEDADDDDNPIRLRLRERSGATWKEPQLKTKEGIAAKVAEKMLLDMRKAMQEGGFGTKTTFSKIAKRWQTLKDGLGEFSKTERFKKMEIKVLEKLGSAAEDVPSEVYLAAQGMLNKLNPDRN